MAQSLIDRLNAIQNLTPDEIAKRLAPEQFILAQTLTQEQFDYFSGKPVAFYSTLFKSWEASSPGPSFRLRIGRGSNWVSYADFKAGFWDKWWIIAQADYHEGIKCPTLSSA